MYPDRILFFEQEVIKIIEKYLQSGSFTKRTLIDTPTDSLSVVNRKYVTLNGTTAKRPTSSVMGQFYYDTSLDRPIWLGNGGVWKNSSGTPV